MIVQFIHLILLCYCCSEFAGYYAKMPHLAAAIWVLCSFLILNLWLPNYTENTIKSCRIPPFFKTYNKFCFFIVFWICLFFVFVNPLSILSGTSFANSSFLTLILAMVLYLIFLKPFMNSLYQTMKPILSEEETQEDFLRARQTVPIIFFPPIAIWLLFEDLGLNKGMELMSEIKTLTLAPLFLFFLYVLSPRLFNWAWKTQNASQELTQRLNELSIKAQTKIAGVKIWNTFKEPLPNAAVAGLISKFRFIYITDYLLEVFKDEQIEAVVGHELGHLRLGHVTTYLIFSIDVILTAVIIKSLLVIYFPFFYIHSTLSYFLEIIIFTPLFAVIFTALARHCEKQADIFSSIITNKESFISSMLVMKLMLGSKPKWFPNWLLTHPEADDRVENVNKTSITQINTLIKSSNILRCTLFGIAIALSIAAITPVNTVFKLSNIYNASEKGDCKLVTNLCQNLPEWLNEHPFILEQKIKTNLICGNYAQAFKDSIKTNYKTDTDIINTFFPFLSKLKLLQF